MGQQLRWGIIGCGGIAKSFIEGLNELPDGCLAGVAASDPARAQTFAETHGAARAFASYQELVQSPEIDAVYIATTHNFHHAHASLALQAGKHVLCEKPLCVNALHSSELIALAKAKGVFLMEAMWTAFLPAIRALQDCLRSGSIGSLRLLQADFGIFCAAGVESRMFNPDLAGGGLLDLGVYPLSFARLLYDADPVHLDGHAQLHEQTGVDILSTMNADYGAGRMAMLSCAVTLKVPHQARLHGEKGRIVIDDFFHPQGFTLYREGAEPEVHTHPFSASGFQFEIAEAQRCIAEGLQQSPQWSLNHSLGVAQSMDQLRQQWGLRYACANEL